MVGFVAILQPPQNGNGVFDAGLIDIDLLETAFQGRIFFNIFAVFIQRSRANTAQFPPSQHGFEQVTRIHGPLGGPSPNDGVNFVDEQNNLSGGIGDFFQYRFQPFFKFTPVFGPSNQRPHIQRDQLAVL